MKKREICGKLSILVLHKNMREYTLIRVRMWYIITLSEYMYNYERRYVLYSHSEVYSICI